MAKVNINGGSGAGLMTTSLNNLEQTGRRRLQVMGEAGDLANATTIIERR